MKIIVNKRPTGTDSKQAFVGKWAMGSFSNDVVYVKIPHHASATSSSLMFERLQKNDTTDAVATTTIFKANKLPDMGLLGKYKFISKEVYSTGSNEAHLYGCIKSSVHLADFNIVTSCDGSAVAV